MIVFDFFIKIKYNYIGIILYDLGVFVSIDTPVVGNSTNAWNVNRNGNLNNNTVSNSNNNGVRPDSFKTKFYLTKVGK